MHLPFVQVKDGEHVAGVILYHTQILVETVWQGIDLTPLQGYCERTGPIMRLITRSGLSVTYNS